MKKDRTPKKTAAETLSAGALVRVCAYCALVIAAAIFLFNGIVNVLDISVLKKLMSTLNFVGQILLAVGIAIPAYDYTCGKRVIWRVVYWAALLVYLLGCVFGVI